MFALGKRQTMARRRRATKRVQPADPKFNSELVARVVRALMKSGKKTTAERIVYGCLLYTSPSPRD